MDCGGKSRQREATWTCWRGSQKEDKGEKLCPHKLIDLKEKGGS